jgi:hypothetical protein
MSKTKDAKLEKLLSIFSIINNHLLNHSPVYVKTESRLTIAAILTVAYVTLEDEVD